MRSSILFKCLSLFCVMQSLISAQTIQVAYSDLIPVEFDQYLLDKPILSDLTLETTQAGTLPMIEEFIAGRLDICLLAIPEGDELPILNEPGITLLPFAYQSAVVIVNADNPIVELTFDQLASIFGASSSDIEVKSWRDLGLAAFSTSSIKAHASKGPQSVSSDLFRFTLLNTNPFKNTVQISTPETVERLVAQDKVAIGIVPNLPQRENLKVVFLAKDREAIAYGPNQDNLYFNDYSIRLPFYIAFRENDTQRLLPVLDFLLKDTVAQYLEAVDFFPVPKMIRDKFAIDLLLFVQENEN